MSVLINQYRTFFNCIFSKNLYSKNFARKYGTSRRKPVRVIDNSPYAKAKTLQEYSDASLSRADGVDETTRDSEYIDEDVFVEDFTNYQKYDDVISDKRIDKAHKLITEKKEQSSLKKSFPVHQKKEANEYVDMIPGSGKQVLLKGFKPKKLGDDTEMRNFIKKLPRILSKNDGHKNVREKYMCIEGWRIVGEYIKAGIDPKAILFSRTNTLAKMNSIFNLSNTKFINYLNSLPMYKTKYRIINHLSHVSTPPGITGIFPISSLIEHSAIQKKPMLPITVVIDKIMDGNNLGGIIRTLASVGIEKLILTSNCCSPWSEKAIRASSGYILNVHCLFNVEWKYIRNHIYANPNVFIAHVSQLKDKQGVPFYFKDYGKNIENTNMNTIEIELDDLEIDENGIEYDPVYEDPEQLNVFKSFRIPTQDVFDINFFKDEKPITLVIGGEKGFGLEAKKFCYDFYGTEISLPLSATVSNLNNNTSAAVIVYEMLRQMKLSQDSAKQLSPDF